MPGQGEPTPTAPEVPAGRHAAEPIPIRGFRPMPGKPATATRTRRKTQRTVTTPLQRPVRRNPTPVYCPRRRGRRYLGRDAIRRPRSRAGKGRVRPVRRANAAQRDLLSEPRRVRGKVRGQRVLLPPEREREHAMGERLVALSGARVPARRHVARLRERAQGTRPDDRTSTSRRRRCSTAFSTRTVASSPASTASRISPGRANRCPANARTGHGANRSLETSVGPRRRRQGKQGNRHHANKEEKQWLELIPRTASTRSWSRAGTASPSSCAPCTTSSAATARDAGNAPNAPSRTNATSRPDGSSNPSASNNGRWTTGNASTRGSSPP